MLHHGDAGFVYDPDKWTSFYHSIRPRSAAIQARNEWYVLYEEGDGKWRYQLQEADDAGSVHHVPTLDDVRAMWRDDDVMRYYPFAVWR